MTFTIPHHEDIYSNSYAREIINAYNKAYDEIAALQAVPNLNNSLFLDNLEEDQAEIEKSLAEKGYKRTPAGIFTPGGDVVEISSNSNGVKYKVTKK